MSDAYARRLALAERMFIKEGELVTWSRNVGTAADPEKPWAQADDTPLSWSGISLLWIPSSNDTKRYQQAGEEGMTIKVKIGMIAGSVPFEPTRGDVVIASDGPWTLSDFDKVALDGQPILYECEFGQ